MSIEFWIGTGVGAIIGGVIGWAIAYFRTEFERSALLVVTVHRAFPSAHPPESYFIRIVNHTPDRELEIKDVWFESAPAVSVLNSQRPLPARLGAGRMWESWIPVADVPLAGNDAFELVRVRLSTGQVFSSHRTPDSDLAPGLGGIAGG